jgi:RNA ligase (TIGR02306 family)
MSEFKVCFSKIREINPHPNSEVHSLEIASIYDFQVVISKRQNLKVGDFLLYIPVDSVLPQELNDLIFPEGSKIKLHNNRVRQIRIQKFPSQGLTVQVETIREYLKQKGLSGGLELKLEHDYAELLGIKKYEPPVPEFQQGGQKQTRNKPLENPTFHQYNGLDNIKWFPDMFKDGELVVIQEKLHGSNIRFGIVPNQANTLLKKIKKFFGLLPKFENVYGSNKVELTNRSGYKGYYGEDVYGAAVKRIDGFSKLKPNEIVYGELIGEGIQKNYNYGHKVHHIVIFDVKMIKEDGTTVWLNPDEVVTFAKDRGFDHVPVLYSGGYNKQLAYELTLGDSVYCPKQKIREGIVVKAQAYNDSSCASKRKSLKWVSEQYLDKDNTDFH